MSWLEKLWLTGEQNDLLRAALLTGDDAQAAWERWNARVDFEIDELGPYTYHLLTFVYQNLRECGYQSPVMRKLKGIYRRAWLENQLSGQKVTPVLRRLIDVGIPVMGHIGLTPQSIHKFGGFTVQGKEEKTKAYLTQSAKELERAGCFSMVLESMPKDLAKEISESIKIPTIGIGAGPFCDGQVLVVNDILGLFEDFKPKFARRYVELGKEIREACKKYLDDVKSGQFPSEEESYS